MWSARHISFLETGRSSPSPEMVMQLATTLGVPLRQINAMLRAAGHGPVYDESDGALPAAILDTLSLLKAHHEPFPVLLLDRTYGVRDLNRGALVLLTTLLGAEAPAGQGAAEVDALGLNLARLTFDPDGAQPLLVNFDEVGRQLLWRIQREVLADPDDRDMQELLDDLLGLPTVDPGWRQVDLLVPSDPSLVLHLRSEDLDLDLRFLTTITAFQAPQNVAVEDLRIETWFPYDTSTAAACRALAARNVAST